MSYTNPDFAPLITSLRPIVLVILTVNSLPPPIVLMVQARHLGRRGRRAVVVGVVALAAVVRRSVSRGHGRGPAGLLLGRGVGRRRRRVQVVVASSVLLGDVGLVGIYVVVAVVGVPASSPLVRRGRAAGRYGTPPAAPTRNEAAEQNQDDGDTGGDDADYSAGVDVSSALVWIVNLPRHEANSIRCLF